MFYTQENRILKIDTPLGKDVLLLTDLSGSEGISTLFSYELTLTSSQKEIDFKKIIGQSVTVSINLPNKKDRYINGIISRFSQCDGGLNEQTGQQFAIYSAVLSPSLWLLSRTTDCQIFQNMSVPRIVEKVLADNKINYKVSLKESYPDWEYCVQYNETDFHFISRLLEEEGIYYYFEHENGKHTMVLIDRKDCHIKCPNQEMARYKMNPDHTLEDEVISNLECHEEIRSGIHVIKDYNFEMPHGNLTAATPARDDEGPGTREAYFYSSGHDTVMEGKRVVKIRMEEDVSQRMVISGTSDCRAFATGYRFKLLDYYRKDMSNKEYLLTSIGYEISQPIGGDAEFSYSNAFNCIPYDVQYRAPWVTEKPLMRGSQTATVTGPAGEEIYVDEHGRVKVQFHWDRYGKKDQNTSCWIRVSYPSASSGFGFQSHPRIGDEVIVDFLEGDPDRPIITGAVYNGANPGAYKLPDNKTRSYIRSNSTIGGGGYNEIRFEDKKGSEEVYFQAEKDWNLLTKNDKGQTVGHDEKLTVVNNRTKSVGVDQTVTIGSNHTETIGVNKTSSVGANKTENIGSNHSVSIGSSKTETVAINTAETIGVAKELTVGGLYQVSVGAAMNETIGAAKAEEIGAAKSVNVGLSSSENVGVNKTVDVGSNIVENAGKNMNYTAGMNYNVKAGKNGVIDIGDQLVIKCGSASIVMKKNGDITIKGKNINVQGSGNIVMKAKKITEN